MQQTIAAKVQQAIALLNEFDLPVWIVQFGRETYDNPQPVQELMVGTTVTWPSVFLVTASGESHAIVATGDLANAQGVGAYDTVTGYVQDVGPALLALLRRLDPDRICVSYSTSDDSADNITHGMWLNLLTILQGTPYADRLVPAERVLGALRARKLPTEVELIRGAVDLTLDAFDLIEGNLKRGVTAREVAARVHDFIRDHGCLTAWDRHYDPAVNFGAASPFGHAAPGDIALQPGMLVHVDLGIKREGYCSDLQRMWYVLQDSEEVAPEPLQRAFDAVVRSMEAGYATLVPGVRGWEVDAAARATLIAAGYPEPEFSLGHQLGQSTHDGGCLLGPRWPRYGNRPELQVEAGHVYTLEYAVRTDAGTIGLEEDVLVTEAGAEYFTPPQTELRYVRL